MLIPKHIRDLWAVNRTASLKLSRWTLMDIDGHCPLPGELTYQSRWHLSRYCPLLSGRATGTYKYKWESRTQESRDSVELRIKCFNWLELHASDIINFLWSMPSFSRPWSVGHSGRSYQTLSISYLQGSKLKGAIIMLAVSVQDVPGSKFMWTWCQWSICLANESERCVF